MRRHIIGALGLAGLFYAGFIYLTQGWDGLNHFGPAVSLRLGIVMSALWLGIPDLNRFFAKYPPWIFLVALVLIAAVVASPKFLPVLIGLLVIALVLKFVTRFFYMPEEKGRSKK